MVTTSRQALDILRETAHNGRLDEMCDRFGLDIVSVFGSALDQAVTQPEDLDVAVRFSRGVSHDLVGVTTALIEMLGFNRVDVLDLGSAGVVARSRALGPGGEGLYEREPGLYALAQMAALTEEMETAPMRRRDLRLLAER